MDKVNTRDRLKQAALALFAERGFAATSIAAIETAAGLAPRAGAFYRHFESKEALFGEVAAECITETPDEFDFEGLGALADTRAELVMLGRQFEKASERQRPFQRLIEELRLTPAGKEFETRANEAMLNALMDWVAARPAAAGLNRSELASLTVNVFGGWLFYLTKRNMGVELKDVDGQMMFETWSRIWADALDRPIRR